MKKQRVNLFCCNSLITVIVASSLIRKKFYNDVNILVLIRNNRTNNNKEIIENCIVNSSNWDYFYCIYTSSIFLEFKKLLWPFNYLPFQSMFILKNKKDMVTKFKNILKKHKVIDEYIFGDNVFMLKYLYNSKMTNISYIEHGASSYDLQKKKSDTGLKSILKKGFLVLTGGSDNFSAKRIYLSKVRETKKMTNLNTGESNLKKVYININQNILNLYSKFISKYQIKEHEAYKELLLIRNMCTEKNKVYLYMPTSIVDDNEYLEYLKKQFKYIKYQNIFVIIKPHSNDRFRDYKQYFLALGIESYIFKNKINLEIPSEFLLLFVKSLILLGSYSSTHLYAKWWLNKKTIFSEVRDSSINHILINEYSGTYKDFH